MHRNGKNKDEKKLTKTPNVCENVEQIQFSYNPAENIKLYNLLILYLFIYK